VAVRKFSSRYIGWKALELATRIAPALKRAAPFYERSVPLIDAGTAQFVVERQEIALSADEQRYTAQLIDPPPPVIERSIALVRLEGATLVGTTGAIIDEAREILLTPRGWLGFVSYHDFRATPTRRVDKPAANYISMVGEYGGHRHYFHFLFDRLPRLHYLLTRFALGREQVVVLTNENLPPFQRDIYRFLAERHSNLSFVSVPENERWRLPVLHVIDDFQPIKRTLAGPDTIAFLRGLVMEGYGVAAQGKPVRLYVTRSDARKRRLINEKEIFALFQARGFRSVEAAKLSFREQIALFANAQAIAGPHGAGFTNMLYAPPGARILEICNLEKAKNTYFLLAKSLTQRHHGVIGGKGDRLEWFRADPAAVTAALDALGL
jgi:hypothetical protein